MEAVVPPEVKEEEHPIPNGVVVAETPVHEEARPAMVPIVAKVIHENGVHNDDVLCSIFFLM